MGTHFLPGSSGFGGSFGRQASGQATETVAENLGKKSENIREPRVRGGWGFSASNNPYSTM
jgi:hypothetical protein